MPVSSNGRTGMVEARHNASMLRRETSLMSQTSQSVYNDASDHLTCWFTIDYAVDAVYYNGRAVNVTGMDGAERHLWAREKRFSIPQDHLVKNAYLTVTGHERDGHQNGCDAGMFELYCNNDPPTSSSDPTMQAYGSESMPASDDPHLTGGGDNADWGQPCETNNTAAFAPSVPAGKAAKIFGTSKKYSTFRVMPYRDADMTNTPAPRAQYVEEYWGNWTGYTREGQDILQEKCSPGNYIVSWTMLCAAPGMPNSITGGPSVGVDRLLYASCSDGAILNVQQGGQHGAAHTIVWPSGHQKVMWKFGATDKHVMTDFDTCGGVSEGEETTYIQECPQDKCPNCTISGFGIRYKYYLEGFRIFCQKTTSLEKTAEVVTQTIQTVQHAIETANGQILSSAQDVNRATDQLTDAKTKEQQAETASDHAYNTALPAQELANQADTDSGNAVDGAAKAEAWSETANKDAKAADILAHNAKQQEEFVTSDIINKEHLIKQLLEQIMTGVEANHQVSGKNYEQSQHAKGLVERAMVLVKAAAKDSSLVSQREQDMAREMEGLEDQTRKVGKDADQAEEDAQNAKLGGIQAVQETENALSSAEKQSATDNANLAKLYKVLQAIKSKQQASQEDTNLMRDIENEASNNTIKSQMAAQETERLFNAIAKLVDTANHDSSAAARAQLQAKNAAQEAMLGLQNVRQFSYRGQIAEEEAARERQTTQDESADTMQTGGMARATLNQVRAYALKTNQSMAAAKRDLGYVENVKRNIGGELTSDITQLGMELNEQQVKKITHAVTAAHQAHHQADVANDVAQTALHQAAVSMSSAHSRMVKSHEARETAGKELASAQQDMETILYEASKTKQMHKEAQTALEKIEEDNKKATDAVATARQFANDADTEIATGQDMLGKIDSARTDAETAQTAAGKALASVRGSLAQIRADAKAATEAKAQATTALNSATSLRKETEMAADAADAAVEAAKTAAEHSKEAVDDAKVDAEAEKGQVEAAGNAAQEAQEALTDTDEAGKMSLEAQNAAEGAIGEVEGAREDADKAVTASETALDDANKSTAVAVEAIEQAREGSNAAKVALSGVSTEANKIKALKEEMDSWESNTVKIEHLLLFLANQSNMNEKTAVTLNKTTEGMVGAVNGLNRTRMTQEKILEGLAKHTEADERIMKVLAKSEQGSEALMYSIKNNSHHANASLNAVVLQGKAIEGILGSLEAAEKTKNSTLRASRAMQSSLNKTVGGIEHVNLVLNGTLNTVQLNLHALNATLGTVGANQKALRSVVDGLQANVDSQNASLKASEQNTVTIGHALDMIGQGHKQDKAMIDALRKMQTADEAQMASADAHAEVDNATLNALEQAQKTDDKLVLNVAKTQTAQKAMLAAIKEQESGLTVTMRAIDKKHHALGKTLQSVQQTQMAQGAQLNALGANSKLIRATVGTVQHNQLTDERVLNDMSGLDRQEHVDAQRLQSAVKGFEARVEGAENQERKNAIVLNQETGEDSHLGTEVNALQQQENIMQRDEVSQRQQLTLASQRQQDVMNVQKVHRKAMMNLAKVQYQSVGYLQGVAGKVVEGENDLKSLHGLMHGIEQGIVGLESQQKSGENELATLHATEDHMGQSIFSVQQRSIHDHSALRLEEEAQARVQKASESIYHQEEKNLHKVSEMEHQVAGGYGSAGFERSLPSFQAKMRGLKGDINVIQADEDATKTRITAMQRQEDEDSHHLLDDLRNDQGNLKRAAEKGADFDHELQDEERVERDFNQSAAEEDHELGQWEHELEEEGRKAAQMSKETDGLDVERVKEATTGVGQKAAQETSRAQALFHDVQKAKTVEERIRDAESVTGKDLSDLEKDNTTFTNQIKSLEKEESDFEDKVQSKLENNIPQVERKITMQMLAMEKKAPDIDGEVHSLSNQQTSKQEEVGAINNGIKTENKVMDKIEKKNDQSKSMDETLEEHQRRLKDNVDAIEAQAEQAAFNIHILAGGLLVFVLVSAVLHNMWRGKIETMEKDL